MNSWDKEEAGQIRNSNFEIRICSSASEHVLQRELHDSRISCRQNPAEVLIISSRDRIAEIHKVRQIERLGSKLDRLFFPDFECAGDADINSNESWTAERISAEAAVRPRRRLCEGRGTEP